MRIFLKHFVVFFVMACLLVAATSASAAILYDTNGEVTTHLGWFRNPVETEIKEIKAGNPIVMTVAVKNITKGRPINIKFGASLQRPDGKFYESPGIGADGGSNWLLPGKTEIWTVQIFPDDDAWGEFKIILRTRWEFLPPGCTIETIAKGC